MANGEWRMANGEKAPSVMRTWRRLFHHGVIACVLAMAGPFASASATASASASASATASASAGVVHYTGPAPGAVTCHVLSLRVEFSPPLTLAGGGSTARVDGIAKGCTTKSRGVRITRASVTGAFTSDPWNCTGGTLAKGGDFEVSLMLVWSGRFDADGFVGRAHFNPSYITYSSAEISHNEDGKTGFLLPAKGGAASLAVGSSFDDNHNGDSRIKTRTMDSSDTETLLSAKCSSLSLAGRDVGVSSLSLGVGSIVVGAERSFTLPTSSSPIFPIAAWLQNPAQTTGFEGGYSTLGAAAAGEGINTFEGLYEWPSAFGHDGDTGGTTGEFQAACNAGEHVIAGGDPSSNTSASSVASVDKIAAAETQAGTGASCSKFLAGYNWDDEPAECSTNVASQVATIQAEDPTRATVDNMAGWVTWGDSGCNSTANAAFAAPTYPSSDDYHNTDPWNTSACKGAAHVSTSPWADCSWLYGYQGAVQTSLAGGKPTWEYIETGTDELGFSSQNGSTCSTTTNACSNGNEYNATAPQVNADAWSAILNGVDGIEWFCHGTAQGQNLSDSDCMGGSGTASNAIFANLKYIDGSIQSYAPELLSPTQGSCTMQPRPSAPSTTPC